MRIDKFLNATNITKRRAVALDMLNEGVVALNGLKVKPSKEIKVGDIITVTYLEQTKRYEVLAIPALKTIPKAQSHLYIKTLD
ncbi:RNA-binding S4 domain-containing protein [Helicobacter heilmannii]|uniref:Ribosome-associated heat shock protein implicated in the recycling of the 50S subunit (S4 paralog) n=1 Tax=Helicobacter heilmannii TaxID=35817 RepID=A0A0K2XHC4_HELHE|nr:RNA-binding S4 domain-containing protein [Helicobacter heilmannii]CCM12023.1 Ribosome-associated heat shock protein implicated in the recycling of the 50S subunit (S4 paralog) [Helicobacter heilmannii ASB1.4]CRF45868.1 Ribosome-associated heat shock protein implicated in the recycling of the 50S subunit (S4 paralog) [Helicobacter heilmannii]CRF48364.1 Ribosome-associated heat shock protein implicated in the recycling of the 50S subunit (S4 paralog) [Helicobacter heilmannii]CRF50023.1 Ribosom